MEERLKVEVQISSYDAKGLQCFVAEQIQKYRPEESGPKKMFKKVAGSFRQSSSVNRQHHFLQP